MAEGLNQGVSSHNFKCLYYFQADVFFSALTGRTQPTWDLGASIKVFGSYCEPMESVDTTNDRIII